MMYKVKTAVAMVVFNRPEFTQKVLIEVGKVKPERLYVIQDGPRPNNRDDVEKIKKVQECFDNLDWDCEIIRNVSPVNLGCCKRPYSGFSWVFEHEDAAIFLEDDCVPALDFFKFCDYILDRYKDDERVMLISGTNVQGNWKRGNYSYHFSTLGGIHGWASWKRAWSNYDVEIPLWNNPDVKALVRQNMSSRLYSSRSPIYDKLVNNSVNASAWDYQWGFSRMVNSGLAIVPCSNLITNIGYGENSTHTTSKKSKEANIELGTIDFPIIDPPFVIADREYDQKFEQILSRPVYREFLSGLKRRVVNIVKK